MAGDEHDDERPPGEGPGRIEGPVVQGGGTTATGEPIGTEIAGSRGDAGTVGGGGAAPGRTPPELDADAVDETGALDDEGETLRERPPVGDPEQYPTATEDRPDSWDYGRARDEEV